MKTRRGRTAVRLLASTSLLTGVLVVAQDSSVVHAAQFTYVPDVLYMGANGTTTPELAPPVTIPPKLPYIVDVPDGTMPFDGEEDPITGYLRKIEVETEENVAQCNASRAAEPIGYSGCSSVKLNVSHGDLPVGGTSAHDDDPDVQVHSGGAYVEVSFDNDDTYEVYIRGLNDEINAALTDLSYVPNADHYHTGEPNDIERLDVLLSTGVGSVDGNSTRSTFIRVMDVNDWPEIEAPPDTDVNAGEAVVFGEVPAPGDEEDFTKYTGDRFEITDEDNDDGTDEDDDDEGDEPKRDGPHDDLLVVMWTTCGSFEITNKNTFSVSEHIEELIGEFFATMGADIDDPVIEGAMATVEQALVDALGQAGLDDTLLATETEWGAGERVAAFAGLAENLPGVIDAFDEVTFFAREPGPSNAGAYLDDTSCDLYAFTSDLGNSGLPVQFFSYYTGSHDIVLPWPAFHWDSVNIEILEAREIEIGFEPSDPIFVNEADAPTPVEAPVVISPGDHPGFSFEWSAVPGTAVPSEDYSGTSNNNPSVPPGVVLLPFPGDAEYSFVDAPGTMVFSTGGPGEGIETFDLVITLPNPAPPGWTFSPQTLTRTVVILEDDMTGPAVVVNQAVGQDDPTSTLPIEFTITFSEAVNGFTAADVVVELDGAAAGDVTITGTGPTYTALVDNLAASGIVTATVPAGAVTAVDDGAANSASFSSDNEVEYVLPRTVSIGNRSAPEGAEGVTSPFEFTIALNEPAFEQVSVNVATAAGTATPGDDYDPAASETTVTFDIGDQNKVVEVDVFGDDDYEPNETFFVNLSGASTGLTIADGQGIGTIENDDPVPTRSVQIADVSLDEGDTPGTTAFVFTLTLDAPAISALQVTATTADDTALVADDDYTMHTDTVTFAPGADEAQFTVIVSGDDDFEPNETFFVNLSAASPGLTIADGQGVGTIVNDDPPPPGQVTLSINDVSANEGDAGTTNFTFTLTLGAAPTGDQTATVTVTGVGATVDEDYEPFAPQVVTFLDGQAGPQMVTVAVKGDGVVEPNETFTLDLSALSAGLALVDGQGLGTILNDDVAAAATIDLAPGQADITSVDPIEFSVQFSGDVTGFDAGDVSVAGSTAPGAVVDSVTGGPADYIVTVTGMTGSGDVVVAVPAGAATDEFGNTTGPTTVIDDTVEFVFVPPPSPAVTVTAQTPVTSTEPVVFDVEFTEDVTGFSDNVTDVVLGGTAAPTSAVISVVDGNSYTVAVSGMSNSGTVTLRVPAAAAAALDDSSPSQISNIASAQYNMQPPQDNTPPVPVITAVTPSPTSASPVVFTVQFSEPVIGFVTGEATAGGTAGANAATVTPVDADTYTVTVTGMGVAGTVTLMVAAGVTEDAAGNVNLASNTATVQWAPAPGPLTITVPSNIVRPNDPGQAGAVVTYPAATASGGVPPTIVTCSIASGAFYPLGTTTVTCTAVDSESGQPDVFTEATVTASFTITVNDTEPPVIATPPDLTRTTTGGNPVSVTFDLPAASDNSGVPPTVTCTRPTVSSYTLGVSSITCTATDGSGNSASSSFTVTVVSQDPGSGPAAPRSPSGTLPATGTGATRLATVAAATLFAGVVLLLARWRGASTRPRV